MQPVLITGAGTLGSAFQRACASRQIACHLAPRSEVDITDPDSLAAAIDRHEPWLVINAAGYVRVDEAELDAGQCFHVNSAGAHTLARACARERVQLVVFSTDLVFDGRKEELYDEADSPAPLNVYGHSKYDAEKRVLESHPQALVVRTSAFFGPWDRYNFVTLALDAIANGNTVAAATDVTVSPTYVPDLADACLDLAIDGESGLWHLTNQGSTTWAELARAVARLFDRSCESIVGVPACELGWRAARPKFSALGSSRGRLLPPLEHALQRYRDQRSR